MTLNINVETKNIVKVFGLAVLFTLGVFSLMKMYDAIIMVAVAFFLALALNPAVSFLSKYMPWKKRGPAIAIVFIALFSILTFLVGSIVPPVVRETSNFATNLPDTLNSSFYRNEKVQYFIDKYDLQDEIDSTIASGRQKITDYGSSALNGLGRLGSSLFNLLTVLVISVLMLTGGSGVVKKLKTIAYRDKKLLARHEELAKKMYATVSGYVVGQVSLASIAALVALAALVLFKVPYPMPLAGIVFAFGLIPLIGNTLAAIIVVLTTLVLKDTVTALFLLGFFVLYQQVENITLQPVVQGKTTNLPPLVIFVSVIFGVALIGPIGGLVAIPVAGCIKILVLDYFEHRDNIKPEDSPIKLVEKIKHKFSSKPSQII